MKDPGAAQQGDGAGTGPHAAAGLDGVNHIRIVLLSGLGDVVHGLPVVNAIRRCRPDCRITWVVEPMPAGLLSPHPAIDRVVVFRKDEGARGVLSLRRSLHGDRPDLTLNFNVYLKSVFPTVASASPRRLGFDRRRTRDGVWLFCNEHLSPGPRSHTQDMFLEFLSALDVQPDPLEWQLECTATELDQAREFCARLDRPMAAVVPASGNPKKDWLPERWAALADRLYSETGLQPVLIGGPGRRETAVARHIIAAARVPVLNAMGDGVRRLIWLVRNSRVVIAPDTGPVHIARALGVPVVGLYGHTNPWRVGPYRMFEDLWIDRYTEPGTAPDPARFDPKHGRMQQIGTAEVFGKVESALSRYPAGSGRAPC